MDDSQNIDTGGSAIKPVSSLRSHFENMTTSRSTATGHNTSQSFRTHSRASSGDLLQRHVPLRQSFDIPRTTPPVTGTSTRVEDAISTDISKGFKQPPTPPPTRRQKALLPPSRTTSPPRVDVTSPKSPPRSFEASRIAPVQYRGPLTPAGLDSTSSQASSSRPFRIPSRSPSPHKRSQSPPFRNLDMPHSAFARKNSNPDVSDRTNDGMKAPPPVNRSGKPKIPNGERSLDRGEAYFQNLELAVHHYSRKDSPSDTLHTGSNGKLGREEPPPIPNHTKPLPSISSVASNTRFDPRPTHYSVGNRSKDSEPRHSLDARPSTSDGFNQRKASTRMDEPKPALPPRRDIALPQVQTHDMVLRNSFDTSTRPSALSLGFSSGISTSRSAKPRAPSTPIASSARDLKPAPYAARLPNGPGTPPQVVHESRGRMSIDGAESPPAADMGIPSLSEYPDLSRANRRPPHYPDGPRMISTGNEARLFDVCGEYVCTTGITTRVWSLLTGKLLLSLPHAEGIRVTSLCFKPARRIEDEGTRLWLGTNWGEMLEIDIASKRTVGANSTAHSRHEVIGIYRHATELWTIDDEGKLYVWPPDDVGSPNLNHHEFNGRVGRRASASVIVGEELWLGFGKEVKIFKPSRTPEDASFAIAEQSMAHLDVGDTTSAAIIPMKREHVYFGHSDGKVSIHSSMSRSCIEVVNVSLYRINSLVAAGSFLWAGFYTGMIFVYDVSTTPWTVKKDWRAHNNPVFSLMADRSSIWKLDRMQVLSLGTENNIGVWDGLLKDDWLENDMHTHDNEFCTFRELSTLVVTWNAGAAKPTDLSHDERDINLFRELFSEKNPPDILVFGLQELVDLENKRTTAKSFFKSKKSDEYGHEHLSRVYRAWRNYFSDCLEQYMPTGNDYVLLHSASLVGLFTCIFVKTSERVRIRDVQAAEIKTGLGGLHGNKGALIVRFIVDDSSLCFINCHLAAGQTQVIHRNNDVASILDAAPLPGHQLPVSQTETFVSGGDGSMVLDHEMCILSGDLNYRIEAMPRDTVTHALRTKDLAKLLERDQLLLQRRKSPGFRLRAFQEAPITFEPTYKYDVGTDDYDSSDKKRVPAWCDRVLYRGADKVKQVGYRRHEVRVSDHRPVSGRFVLQIKTIKADKRLDVWRQSEQRFQQEKRVVSTSAKLDYLRVVFGLSTDEAHKLLRE